MKKILLIPFIIQNNIPVYFVGKRPKSLMPEYTRKDELWQFPTGKIGDNIKSESVVNGALRELKEELGVSSFKNFINNDYSFRWSKRGQKEKVAEQIFAVELENNKIKLEERGFDDYMFAEKEKVKNLLFFDSHKKFLEKIDGDINKRKYAKIFVFVGPGGSGKGAILDLLGQKTKLERAKTVTSRERGSSDGDEGRIFVSKQEFQRMEKAGEFIETNFFKGNYYGSLRHEIESKISSGKSALVELDLNGAESIRKIYSNVVSIFIYVDIKTLRNRMIKRGRDSQEEIEKRLKISEQELKKSKICDYIIKNKDGMLENTVEKILKIINKEKGLKND